MLHLPGLHPDHRVLVHHPRALFALARLPERQRRLRRRRQPDPLWHWFGPEVAPELPGLEVYVIRTFAEISPPAPLHYIVIVMEATANIGVNEVPRAVDHSGRLSLSRPAGYAIRGSLAVAGGKENG